MHRADAPGAMWRLCAAWLLLALMLLPPVRRMTESGMTTHMLIQYPCLMLVGALLVAALPARWLAGAQRWNELGIAGLVGSALTLAVLMIPRVLDLALVDARVEALKLIALVASGAALRLSWQRAGVVLQAFFLGNVLPMTAVAGTLYAESAARVCNAYRLDDQQGLGLALVVIAIATAALWLAQIGAVSLRLRARVKLPFIKYLNRP
ncbi:MAG: hypothetical protein V4750_10970 [Pseudomonadota bacterium]